MSVNYWSDLVASITPNAAFDLDAALGDLTANPPSKGQLTFPADAAKAPLPLRFAEPTTVCFGARITEDTPNRLALATTLAQMAAEKGATPIILSHVDHAGLEQFGFRVERVGGQTYDERAACEAQLCSFWNIVMVI